MARQTPQNAPFNEYEIEVSISVRRRSGEYSSTKMADVTAKESLTMAERDLPRNFAHLCDEARDKALKAMDIRCEFEMNMLALEAGSTVVEA